MNEIYGNASLTLAVSAAKSVADGIFGFPIGCGLSTCIIPYRLMDGTIRNAYAQFHTRNQDEKQPLKKRAWAFQESLISSRVLSFQTNELVWECHTEQIYGSGVAHRVRASKQRNTKSWEQHISEYTRCSRTFASDNLAGLSGFVKARLAAATSKHAKDPKQGDTYVAGLWLSSLSRHILWYVPEGPLKIRPRTYIAPTFSWASIDQPVSFLAPEAEVQVNTPFEPILGWSPKGLSGGSPGLAGITDATILEISITQSSLNPFGSINEFPASFLRIEGLLQPATGLQLPKLGSRGTWTQAWDGWHIFFDIASAQPHNPSCIGVHPSCLEGNIPLFCLRMSSHIAMILTPVQKRGITHPDRAFERVGLMRTKEGYTSIGFWFGVEKTVLLLV
jgi:hypothetical protein